MTRHFPSHLPKTKKILLFFLQKRKISFLYPISTTATLSRHLLFCSYSRTKTLNYQRASHSTKLFIMDMILSSLKKYLLVGVCMAVSVLSLKAHNEIPGEKQKNTIALTNARIYTISNGVIEKGTVMFANGKIMAVGANVQIPPGAEVINCDGKSVYPGFIAPNTTLGITEVDLVRSTRDMSESGIYNSNARGEVAYNPDSELLPTVRMNGVLIANVVPQGGIISGTASLMMLDGWTREDAGLNARNALSVNFPDLGVSSFNPKPAEEQIKENEKEVQSLHDYFSKAKMYSRAAQNGLADNAKDIRLEAIRPVFEKNMPVMIQCSEYKQILAAIEFAKKFNLNAILVGCDDAWRCIDEIKASGYGLVIGRVHSLPRREEDPYDITYRLPKILKDAGIKFAFSDGGSWQQRNLPFQAGSALAFGLDEADALKALTLNPAAMFGVDKQVGSLEPGKDATLFVSNGNALDVLTNAVELAFMQGRKVQLESKQTRLAQKYRTRFKQSR